MPYQHCQPGPLRVGAEFDTEVIRPQVASVVVIVGAATVIRRMSYTTSIRRIGDNV